MRKSASDLGTVGETKTTTNRLHPASSGSADGARGRALQVPGPPGASEAGAGPRARALGQRSILCSDHGAVQPLDSEGKMPSTFKTHKSSKQAAEGQQPRPERELQ